VHLANTIRPQVWLVGDVEHPDFADAVALLHDTAGVGPQPPELIVVAQSRSGAFPSQGIERLRRSAPLAGVVALLGSWCEGETRSGRPVAGVARVYWHEFPSWWRRQLTLRAAGDCPEWARLDNVGLWTANGGLAFVSARVAIETNCWETAAAIEDVLQSVGAEAIWVRPGREAELNDAAVGIWDGGQLNDCEVERLAAFCAKLEPQHAPVLALLDFPRRDRCKAARSAGAAAVMGKPWLNVDLVATLWQTEWMAKRTPHAA